MSREELQQKSRFAMIGGYSFNLGKIGIAHV